jgi:hypothetical protein
MSAAFHVGVLPWSAAVLLPDVSAGGLEGCSSAASGEVAAESAAVEAQRVDLVEREQMSDFVKVPAGEPIPLSHLALDLAEPANGWAAYLADHGISIAFDDLGRRAIGREDAKKLLDAQRQDEIRRQDLAARNEAAAIEADRQFRASLPRGQAWYDMPPGVRPAEAMLQQAHDAQPRRRSLLEDAFAGTPSTMYIEEPQPVFEDEAS